MVNVAAALEGMAQASRAADAALRRAAEAAKAVDAATRTYRTVGQMLARVSGRARLQAVIERRKEAGEARAAQLEAIARLVDRIASRLAVAVLHVEATPNTEPEPCRAVLCLHAPGSPHLPLVLGPSGR